MTAAEWTYFMPVCQHIDSDHVTQRNELPRRIWYRKYCTCSLLKCWPDFMIWCRSATKGSAQWSSLNLQRYLPWARQKPIRSVVELIDGGLAYLHKDITRMMVSLLLPALNGLYSHLLEIGGDGIHIDQSSNVLMT